MNYLRNRLSPFQSTFCRLHLVALFPIFDSISKAFKYILWSECHAGQEANQRDQINHIQRSARVRLVRASDLTTRPRKPHRLVGAGSSGFNPSRMSDL
jgi:hypothetical protein